MRLYRLLERYILSQSVRMNQASAGVIFLWIIIALGLIAWVRSGHVHQTLHGWGAP